MSIIDTIFDLLNLGKSNSYSSHQDYLYTPSKPKKRSSCPRKRSPTHKPQKTTNQKLSVQPLQPLWQKKDEYNLDAYKLIKDCLKKINLKAAESAVMKLQQNYPEKTPRELARILIIQKSFRIAKVNWNHNDPGCNAARNAENILQGLSTVELFTIVKFSAEMIYQVSIIYGSLLRHSEWKFEVLSVFGAALLGEQAIKIGIDWLKDGIVADKTIKNETKALIIYALGNTTCLFYEAKFSQNLSLFKSQKNFNKITWQSQCYIKRYPTKGKTIKLIKTEIEKAFPIDYSKLRNLLESKDWKSADQETFELISKLICREEMNLCDAVSMSIEIKSLPEVWLSKIRTNDLNIINSLWLGASNGHFGFSVQKQIYNTAKDIEDFGKFVGWQEESGWKLYEQLDFSLNASQGHLPGLWLNSAFLWDEKTTVTDWLRVFFNRTDLWI